MGHYFSDIQYTSIRPNVENYRSVLVSSYITLTWRDTRLDPFSVQCLPAYYCWHVPLALHPPFWFLKTHKKWTDIWNIHSQSELAQILHILIGSNKKNQQLWLINNWPDFPLAWWQYKLAESNAGSIVCDSEPRWQRAQPQRMRPVRDTTWAHAMPTTPRVATRYDNARA